MPPTLADLLEVVRTSSRSDVTAFLSRAGWTQDDVSTLLYRPAVGRTRESACRGCGVDTSRAGRGRPQVWCSSPECKRVQRKLKWIRGGDGLPAPAMGARKRPSAGVFPKAKHQ